MPHSAPPIGPIRILQVEDSEMDAELISMQLLDHPIRNLRFGAGLLRCSNTIVPYSVFPHSRQNAIAALDEGRPTCRRVHAVHGPKKGANP